MKTTTLTLLLLTLLATDATGQAQHVPPNAVTCQPIPNPYIYWGTYPYPVPTPPVEIVKEIIREVPVPFPVPGPERVIIRDSPLHVWDIAFDFGQAIPRAKCKDKLDQIAAFLQANPSRSVILAGHADVRTLQGQPLNVHLADARARSVVEALRARGVPQSQLRVLSFGAQLPVWVPYPEPPCPPVQPGRTSTAQEARCEKDRRVEVLVK